MPIETESEENSKERQSTDCDVCVIGGGPSGASVALRLANLGYHVCLFDRGGVTRPRLESLMAGPSGVPLLASLGFPGADPQVEAIRPLRSWRLWGEEEPALTYYTDRPAPILIERGQLDTVLRSAACIAGARVFRSVAVVAAERSPGDGTWRVEAVRTEEPVRRWTFRARFLVHAGGGRCAAGITGGIGGQSQQRRSPPTIALQLSWDGGESTAVGDAQTWLEAGADAWLWGATTGDGRVHAQVFTAPEALGGRANPGLYAQQLLAQSRLLGELYAARNKNEAPVIYARRASCYVNKNPVGEDWICTGDAAFSPDPLASQGVVSAVRTGALCAAVVHTTLAFPAEAEAARRFYVERLCQTATNHGRAAVVFYAEAFERYGGHFWEERASRAASGASKEQSAGEARGTGAFRPSPQARICVSGVFDGDRIRQEPVLIHPALDGPIGFLNGCPVGRLLLMVWGSDNRLGDEPLILIGRSATAVEIADHWRLAGISPRETLRLLVWLCRKGVMETYPLSPLQPA